MAERKVPPTPKTLTSRDLYLLIHWDNENTERPFAWLKADPRLAEAFREIEQDLVACYPEAAPEDLQLIELTGYYVSMLHALLERSDWEHPREVHSDLEKDQYLKLLRLLRSRIRSAQGDARGQLTQLRERMLRAFAKDRRDPHEVYADESLSTKTPVGEPERSRDPPPLISDPPGSLSEACSGAENESVPDSPALLTKQQVYQIISENAELPDYLAAWVWGDPRLKEVFAEIKEETRVILGPDTDVEDPENIEHAAFISERLDYMDASDTWNDPREYNRGGLFEWILHILRLLRFRIPLTEGAEQERLIRLRTRILRGYLEGREKRRQEREAEKKRQEQEREAEAKLEPAPPEALPTLPPLTSWDLYRLVDGQEFEPVLTWLKADPRLANAFRNLEQDARMLFPSADESSPFPSIKRVALYARHLLQLDEAEWEHPREVFPELEHPHFFLLFRFAGIRAEHPQGEGEQDRFAALYKRLMRPLAKERWEHEEALMAESERQNKADFARWTAILKDP